MTGTFLPKTAFIGFDHILKQIEQVSNHAKDTYPPHNVIKVDSNFYEIELAIAGFTEKDLTIDLKNNVLTISGESNVERPDAQYVYKGISTRKFVKSFRLSEYTEVVGANLSDGILSLKLEVKLPEEKAPVRIKIHTDTQRTA